MKNNEIDEQQLSVSPFALQSLVLKEKNKKTKMKKNENNEMDNEEMEEIWAH